MVQLGEIQVEFSRKTNFTGASGYRDCSGIDLQTVPDGKVMLSALTGNGKVGRCDITIPLEDIDKLVEALQKLREPAFLESTQVGLLVPVEELPDFFVWLGESISYLEVPILSSIVEDTGRGIDEVRAGCRALWNEGHLEVL